MSVVLEWPGIRLLIVSHFVRNILSKIYFWILTFQTVLCNLYFLYVYFEYNIIIFQYGVARYQLINRYIFKAEDPLPVLNPCQPSPCGPNAQCQVINDQPSCSCLQEFIGSPPNCRYECISNSECSNKMACINQKCRDPCVNACGINAVCNVVSHTPMCACLSGYTGDPFTQCSPERCKIIIELWY